MPVRASLGVSTCAFVLVFGGEFGCCSVAVCPLFMPNIGIISISTVKIKMYPISFFMFLTIPFREMFGNIFEENCNYRGE